MLFRLPSALAVATLASLCLTACKPAPVEKTVEEPSTPAVVAPPALGTFTTPAKIAAITDAGYPMFVVTAQFQDRATAVELLLNAEDVELGGADRESFVGRDVTLTYEVVAENNLFDLKDGDLSLVPEAPAHAPHWKTVSGVLSGAERSTGGDLPDLIAVTDAAGVKTEFEYFVTPQIVAANGKQVTAWYSPGVQQLVKAMRAPRSAANDIEPTNAPPPTPALTPLPDPAPKKTP